MSAATFTAIGTIATLGAGVLSLASSLTASKPTASATGSPDQFTANPDGGVPYAMGRTATSGSIVFRRAWDTGDKGDNDRQTFVVVASLGRIEGFESFTADQVSVEFADNGSALSGGFGGWMWQLRQLGNSPEANPVGFGETAGTPPGWSPSRKFSGLATASWTLRFDTKAEHYQNGVPKPQWVVKGVRVYDPRRDSTYPGGSGAHRADDETTWEYSENPYLHGLTWVIGRHQNGQRVMGVGAPIATIDVAAFVEGANIADTNDWKVAGVAYSTDGKWDTLKKILQAGMGEPLQLGASISCLVNSPKVSLATITTADVVGDASVAATQPRRNRINGIVPRYRQEFQQWQYLSGTAVRVPLYEAEDGGRRSKEVDYSFIPSDALLAGQADKQVSVAARYDIENAREFGPITLPLKLRWIGYKPGDCVTAVLPELGLASQTILLLNRDFDPSSGIVTMTARSETAAKHPFALGQTTTPPPTPGVSAEALVPVPGSLAWAITATSIAVGQTQTPALVVTGSVDSPVAEAVIFEYRGTGTSDWLGQTVLEPTATGTTITGIKPGAAYEVAVSYRRRGIVGARLILGPVAVGDLKLDFNYVTGDTKPADNATNSADPNSPVGDKTAGEVSQAVDQVTQLQSDFTNAQTDTDAALLRIEAAARQGSPNLLLNGDFSDGFNHWSATPGAFAIGKFATVGQYVDHIPGSGSGPPSYLYQDVPVVQGVLYSFSLEGNHYSGGVAYITGEWLAADHTTVLGTISGIIDPTGNFGGGSGPGGRYAVAPEPAPPGTSYLRILCYVDDATAGLQSTRYMVQEGAATAWRDDASQAAVTHRVTSLEGDGASYAEEISTISAKLAGTVNSGLKDSIAVVDTKAQAGVDAQQAVGQLSSAVNAEFQSVDNRFSGTEDSPLKQAVDSKATASDIATAVASEAEARAQQIQSLRVSYNGQELTLDQIGGVVATHDGRLQGFWGLSFNGGAPVFSAYYIDAGGNVQQGVTVDGTLLVTAIKAGTIVASHFVTDQGVDLAALVPGSFNFELAGNDGSNSRGVSSGQNVGPIAGSANGNFSSHRIDISASGGILGGSGGAEPSPFTVNVDLYYNTGSGWTFGATIGQAQSFGSYVSFNLSSRIGPVSWGASAQLALYLHGITGSGTVYSAAWDADVTFRK